MQLETSWLTMQSLLLNIRLKRYLQGGINLIYSQVFEGPNVRRLDICVQQ